MENISTRSDGDPLRISNVTRTDTARRGRLIVDNYRVLLVNFADIIVFMLRSRGIDMPKIVNSFTTDTGLNDVLVHGFVCRR